jgi:hypothetical protein
LYGRIQPVAALDELYQSFNEARRRSAVYDIVVEGDRQVEQVARFNTLLDDGWLACDAAHNQEDGLPGRRQAPAPPVMPSAVTPTVPPLLPGAWDRGGRPDTGHIHFQQCVNAVLPPIQVEVIVSVPPCRRDLYDAIIRGHLRHRNSSPTVIGLADVYVELPGSEGTYRFHPLLAAT